MPSSYRKCSKLCPYYNSMHLPSDLKQDTPLKLEKNASKILLVFQNPGIDEWMGIAEAEENRRAPISSQSGHSAANRIRNAFERLGVLRKEFDITEAVQCYAGKYKNGRDKKPRIKAIRCCKAHLEYDIMAQDYDKIIAFGTIAQNVVQEILQDNHLSVILVKARHPSAGVSNIELDNYIKSVIC